MPTASTFNNNNYNKFLSLFIYLTIPITVFTLCFSHFTHNSMYGYTVILLVFKSLKYFHFPHTESFFLTSSLFHFIFDDVNKPILTSIDVYFLRNIFAQISRHLHDPPSVRIAFAKTEKITLCKSLKCIYCKTQFYEHTFVIT